MSADAIAAARDDGTSSDEYIRRADALLPLLRQRATQDDADRCVHPDVIAAMKQVGLFRILQPRRLGGAELDLRTMHQVIRRLATASPSASWVLVAPADYLTRAGSVV
jgi:3-hydroxy-9,10-secoandrosta-1,3,5(10)-triene-9,17-dione monooxygenase